jgi:hypothetical protein
MSRSTLRLAGLVLAAAALAALFPLPGRALADADGIRPWEANPRYWQYKGEPTLLLGGTDDDNLFQWPADRLEPHLTLLKQAGGNYVRNTMSDRRDGGFELYAFARRDDGKYDLESWNEAYWERFERFLQWTGERDIIVQIEVWDRFDYSREHWPPHPYNPINNVNYSREASTLAPEYPEHPGANVQPFFFTTPPQRNNTSVLRYQQRFVDRMLQHALKHGHVLYCVDNETKGEESWARYWAEYIKTRARDAGRAIYVTEMWDDWDVTAPRHRQTLDHPDLYDFADLSQNNHNSGRQHWQNAVWAREYVAAHPRPINAVKTYGADGNRFGHSDQDGLERFFRHLLAGFASARFHRPDAGLGSSAKAQAAIAMVRRLESLVRLWELSPDPGALDNGQGGDVYTAAAADGTRVLYFPAGGRAALPLAPGGYHVAWVGARDTIERTRADVDAGALSLSAPDGGHWLAVLRKR